MKEPYMTNREIIYCSFCSTPHNEVKKMIEGPGVYICDGCIEKCLDVIQEAKTEKSSLSGGKSNSTSIDEHRNVRTPREIKEFLDQYVIGQDFAKEVIAVGVYNHIKRIENPTVDGVEIDKSNILLCGPTGVGKTLLAQTIARMLKVPFAMADATSLTEAGYVGEDVESILGRLLAAADNNVRRAETGIIFLDEIDKKKAGNGGTNSRDVSGEGVQQALLKLLEGSEVMVAPSGMKKMSSTEMVKINTKNILFIVGGAFVGLEKLVEKALNKDSGIGFSSTIGDVKVESLLNCVEPEHLMQFGLIPELIGRLPIIAPLSDLNEDQLVNVLTEPKNALIKQMTALFRLEGVQLEFEPDALRAVAKIAKERKTNGRALRSVLETRLMKTQFNLPDLRKSGVKKIVVNAASINDGVPPMCYKDEDDDETVFTGEAALQN
jgi:ATP-dependent Clp protease ATP-binding subunit ClpX